MHIPLRLRVAMIAAFFAILGVWSFLWSSFIHALPMWGVYAVDAIIAVLVGGYYLKQWLDRRSAVSRAVVREHHFDAGPGNARLRSRTD